MKEPLDLSYGLLTKAAHDLRAAEIGIENEATLDTVAFHVQQCAEKLIKAFLNWKQVQYPKTHVFAALLDLATHMNGYFHFFFEGDTQSHPPNYMPKNENRLCRLMFRMLAFPIVRPPQT